MVVRERERQTDRGRIERRRKRAADNSVKQ